jgi:mannose-6-phosphate isomerase
VKLIDCPYFTINAIGVDGELERDVISRDSFVLYSCTEGEVDIIMGDNVEHLVQTDVVMVPAEADCVTIKGKGSLMETYISK